MWRDNDQDVKNIIKERLIPSLNKINEPIESIRDRWWKAKKKAADQTFELVKEELIFTINEFCNTVDTMTPEDNRKKIKDTLRKANQQEKEAKRAGTTSIIPFMPEVDDKGREHNPPVRDFAKEILNLHNFAVIRDTPGHLWHEENRVYKNNGEGILRKLISDSIDDKNANWSPAYAGAIVKKIADMTIQDRADFDTDPMILNCPNGFVDLMTGEIIKDDTNLKSLIQIDAEYKPKLGRSESYEKSLIENIGERYAIMLLQYMGASLTRGEVHPEKVVFLVGDGNNSTKNGKSMYANAYAGVLGPNCVSNLDFQDVQNDTYALWELQDVIANVGLDNTSQMVEYFHIYKKLTTKGDRLSIHTKGVKRRNVNLNTFILNSCNELPLINEDSHAVWDRLCIIPFTKLYEKNPEFEAQFHTEEEKSRILNSLIYHLQNVIKNKRFTYVQKIEEVKALHRDHSDTTTKFINHMLRPIRKGEKPSPVTKVTSVYLEYCSKLNKPAKTPNLFNEQMERHGYERYITRDGKKSVQCWKDITLIDPQDDNQTILKANNGHA